MVYSWHRSDGIGSADSTPGACGSGVLLIATLTNTLVRLAHRMCAQQCSLVRLGTSKRVTDPVKCAQYMRLGVRRYSCRHYRIIMLPVKKNLSYISLCFMRCGLFLQPAYSWILYTRIFPVDETVFPWWIYTCQLQYECT